MLELKNPRHWLAHACNIMLPRICPGCSRMMTVSHEAICMRCMATMPRTGFFEQPDNPVERLFWGRSPVDAAGSLFYFTRGSSIQRILHALKYKGNRQVGLALGNALGESMMKSSRYRPPDAIIPLPLHPERERNRGYNQADYIARGCAEIIGKPVYKGVVMRHKKTETQTTKSRFDRWNNLTGVFGLSKPEHIRHKHLLLVDDVVTTGASLEACAQALIAATPASLRIATIAYATQ